MESTQSSAEICGLRNNSNSDEEDEENAQWTFWAKLKAIFLDKLEDESLPTIAENEHGINHHLLFTKGLTREGKGDN